MPKFIHKYKQLTERMDYEEAKQHIQGDYIKYHLGQMKLLLSEVYFLLKSQLDVHKNRMKNNLFLFFFHR